jgi:hypothetical protein
LRFLYLDLRIELKTRAELSSQARMVSAIRSFIPNSIRRRLVNNTQERLRRCFLGIFKTKSLID